MAPTTPPSADTCHIEKLPAELLEKILLENADVTPPDLYFEDEEEVVRRCDRAADLGHSLAFRLTSRTFRDCSWRVLAAFIAEAIFDLRSRQSISNLTALSTCKNLAPWVTKLTIACNGTPEQYPHIDEMDDLSVVEKAFGEDAYAELLRIKDDENAWYPNIWDRWMNETWPKSDREVTMNADYQADTMELQELLSTAFQRCSNISQICYYQALNSHPGRYYRLFQRCNKSKRRVFNRADLYCGCIAYVGLELLICAMAAAGTTVRTMTLAVDLDEHHAFITNVSRDIFAKVSQEVETLTLNDTYCLLGSVAISKDISRLSIARDLFPKLRSLTVDHSHFPEFTSYQTVTPIPSLSDIPRLRDLTLKNVAQSEETMLTFVRHYGHHAQRVAIKSPTRDEYDTVLEVIRHLHLEIFELEHPLEESFWAEYLENEDNDKWSGGLDFNLEEFPQASIQQAAKVVTLSPPSFKVALENYWLKYPGGRYKDNEA